MLIVGKAIDDPIAPLPLLIYLLLLFGIITERSDYDIPPPKIDLPKSALTFVELRASDLYYIILALLFKPLEGLRCR